MTIIRTTKKDFIIRQVETETPNGAIPSNAFNTPVYDNLYFNIDGYFDEKNVFQSQVLELHVNNVLLTVSQTKNIIKTAIQGRAGTVKEYISAGDYIINGSGTITDDNNVFPIDDLTTLKNIFEVPDSIPVVSEFLNLVFDITDIVIESTSFAQVRGSRNEVAFSFSASSDTSPDINEFE